MSDALVPILCGSIAGLSLALIGNALGRMHEKMQRLNRGVFDKEARRKPLAFAADAVNSTAACIF